MDDEAAEEEEEGAQAGLGDFGFTTSNIREHDEEMVSFLVNSNIQSIAIACVDSVTQNYTNLI